VIVERRCARHRVFYKSDGRFYSHGRPNATSRATIVLGTHIRVHKFVAIASARARRTLRVRHRVSAKLHDDEVRLMGEFAASTGEYVPRRGTT
jgi:hypothetical protein